MYGSRTCTKDWDAGPFICGAIGTLAAKCRDQLHSSQTADGGECHPLDLPTIPDCHLPPMYTPKEGIRMPNTLGKHSIFIKLQSALVDAYGAPYAIGQYRADRFQCLNHLLVCW